MACAIMPAVSFPKHPSLGFRFSKRHGPPHSFCHTASMRSFNGGQRIYFPAPSTTANIYARVMEAADKKNADILADVFLKVPILLCVPAPAGGGNSKKNFELGKTKSNWES